MDKPQNTTRRVCSVLVTSNLAQNLRAAINLAGTVELTLGPQCGFRHAKITLEV